MFAPFATLTVDPPSLVSFATWARVDNSYARAGFAIAWDSHSDLGEIVLSHALSSGGIYLKDAEVGRQVYSVEGRFPMEMGIILPISDDLFEGWPYGSGATLALRHRLLGYYSFSSSTGVIRMPTWSGASGPSVSDFGGSHPPAWANG